MKIVAIITCLALYITTPAAYAQDQEENLVACEARADQMIKQRFIRDYYMEGGYLILEMVRSTFMPTAYQTKEAIAQTLACVMTKADPARSFAIKIRDHHTGAIMAIWDGHRLTVPD